MDVSSDYGYLLYNDWNLIGSFVGKMRQTRRKARTQLEQAAKDLQARSFVQRKACWKASGKVVCRHGVIWRRRVMTTCPCMSDDADHVDWLDAVLMPALDHESRSLVVTPFDGQYFRRLGFLQAEMRRLQW